MPEEYQLRYQFQPTPTPTDMSLSSGDSTFVTPPPLEASRPSISEQQHVTSGVSSFPSLISEFSLMHFLQRRRAQNRAAQRAYRERKEKHARGLEAKLLEMTEKYKNLEISHAQLKVAHDKLGKIFDLLVKGDNNEHLPSNAETLRKLLFLLYSVIAEREKLDC